MDTEVQECGHERLENLTKFPRPTQKLDGVINTDWTSSKVVFPTSEFLPELYQGGLDSGQAFALGSSGSPEDLAFASCCDLDKVTIGSAVLAYLGLLELNKGA